MNQQDETITNEDADVDELQEEVASGDVDIADEIDWEGKYKRALADYQNLEKRSQEARREWIVNSNRDLLLRILPVLDTLVLAKEHSKDQSLMVSVQQFLDILKSEGVIKIETIGKVFDPHIMEAVSTVEGEEGKVVTEVQSGYMINEKLLRPALVNVGKEVKN